MTEADLAAIEREAMQLAATAGERALELFRAAGGPALEFKGQRQDDPVTAADREIETYLRQELRARFPAHGIIGEEQQDELAGTPECVWVLDPLDGTANYAAGLPIWGVSMGLLHRGSPVVGCLWVPMGPGARPGVFHARTGGGTWFEGRQLRVDTGEDERGRILALPGRYWRTFRFRRPAAGTTERRQRGADNRALGSIAAELALVSAGILRLAVFVQPKIWDVAAGVLLVREAGGTVLTWHERQWLPFTHCEPAPPRRPGDGPAALRHWSRPILVGSRESAAAAAERLIWQPRMPKRLREALGLGS